MGLDQYARIRKPGEEIMYWRKHNRLQGWMTDLWMKRTGNENVDNFFYLSNNEASFWGPFYFLKISFEISVK